MTGTPGYMDPEFVNNARPSAEADVFSFGVVLLELACDRWPTDARQPNATTTSPVLLLIDWVPDMYHRNRVLGAAERGWRVNLTISR
jgi:serine/threonine protein kinase